MTGRHISGGIRWRFCTGLVLFCILVLTTPQFADIALGAGLPRDAGNPANGMPDPGGSPGRLPFTLDSKRIYLLETPTYDGSGQAVHPDIIHFANRWNGFSYWMILTPYPWGNDKLENPSILASNDGICWSVPAGLSNPLMLASATDANYQNDPELTWDGGRLNAYWGVANGNAPGTYHSASSDGKTWSAPSRVIPPTSLSCRQMTVIHDGNLWKMWTIYTPTWPNTMIYSESTDGLSWNPVRACTGVASDHRDPWHIAIQKVGDEYWGLLAECDNNASGLGSRLYFIRSHDGLAWSSYPLPILSPAPDTWYSNRVYRSTFTVEDGLLRVWFSASGVNNAWHIGYVETHVPRLGKNLWSDNAGVEAGFSAPGMLTRA